MRAGDIIAWVSSKFMVSDMVYKTRPVSMLVVGCVQVFQTLPSRGIGPLSIVQSLFPGYQPGLEFN